MNGCWKCKRRCEGDSYPLYMRMPGNGLSSGYNCCTRWWIKSATPKYVWRAIKLYSGPLMQPGCPCRADLQRRMSQAEGLPPLFSQPKSLEFSPLHMSVNVSIFYGTHVVEIFHVALKFPIIHYCSVPLSVVVFRIHLVDATRISLTRCRVMMKKGVIQ